MKLQIDNTFNFEQRKVIDKYFEIAKEKFNIQDKIISIEIKNSGRLKTSAGNATIYRIKNCGIIKMNKRLFNSTVGIKEFENTFSHELAHVIANIIHNCNCGHDARWKRTHIALGGNAKRTHNYDVSHLRPTKNRFDYKCNCQIFKLSAVRHNKMQNGKAKYYCKKCKEYLKRV
jgi:SprT protein